MRQRRSHARFQTPTKNSATRMVRRSDVRTRLGSRRFNVNDADALGSRGSGPQDLHSSLYFAAALSTLPKDGALTPRPTPGIGASILVMISIASLCWLIKKHKISLAMYSLVFAFMFANVRCNRRSLRTRMTQGNSGMRSYWRVLPRAACTSSLAFFLRASVPVLELLFVHFP